MKRISPHTLSVFIILLLFSSGASPKINAQTARPWPTRWQAGDTPADVTLTRTLGLSILDELGQVVGIGDFNGDHTSDYLVSYSKYVDVNDSGVLGATMVRYGIFFGKPNQTEPVSINIDKRTPDLTLDFDYRLISFISTVGDVNSDHIDDLMLIERAASSSLGNIRILFGSPRLQVGHLNVTQQPPDLQIISPSATFNPINVRTADLNGDGANDLVLADNIFQATHIYGVLGPFASGRTVDPLSTGAALVITDRSEANAQLLAPADLNGDGKSDILILRFASAPSVRIGPSQLQIVFGTADGPSSREISLADGQADATLDIGFIIGGFAAGDINGDGAADLLIGRTTRYDSGPPLESGWIDVIFGSPTLAGRIDHIDARISGLPPSNSTRQITLPDLFNHLGASIVARDLNADGFTDIVIGTLGVEDSDIEETLSPGRTHILFGAADFAGVRIEKEEQDVSIIFGKRQRDSGSPVNVGDFNGDGIPDVLVSGIDEYIFFGGPLGAPQITTAKYKTKTAELTIFGADFNGAARVEVNGVLIDQEVIFDAAASTLVLRGTPAELNLRDGRNQVVVLRKGARSNAVKIKVK